MTRATLLHVLDQPTALGPAEVRELEQLAQAFPYCQTAHLLLAKAAHDQGTMLAGQRLRRAATYAADRTLLRRLIEQVEPAAQPLPLLLEAAAAETPVSEPVHTAVVVAPELPSTPLAVVQPEPVAQAPMVTEPQPTVAPVPAQPFLVEVEPLSEPVAQTVPELAQPEPLMVPEAATGAEAVERPEAAIAETALASTVLDVVEAEPETVTQAPEPEREAIPSASAELLASSDAAAHVAEPLDAAVFAPSVETLPAAEPEPEPVLPPQAPAIRPPVEAGDARFEFGLAEPPAPAAPTYELPGLVDEWAASAVTRSLGTPGSLPERFAAPVATPAGPSLTPAAFTGDETVGYSLGESSRLGLSLQLLNLLTNKAESSDTSTQFEATNPRLAAPLPPTGTFFEPDPLLLDHWQRHAPLPVLTPSSLDLINNFLRRQPRLTRPAMLPPSPAVQADLSVRSTRVEPDLVSESLARILVRQGKTARAIEVYEKLMVKLPEKATYFMGQIQQLRPTDKLGH